MSTRRQIIEKNGIKPTKTGSWLISAFLGHIPDMKPKGIYKRSQLSKYLIECYLIDDIDAPKLVSVFEGDYREDNEELAMIILKLSKDNTFFDHVSDLENNEFGVINQLPIEFLEDYRRFKKGEYSKFSSKLKERLVDAYGKVNGEGFKDNGLPIFSYGDVLFPEEKQKQRMVDYLNEINNIGIKVKDIKELLDAPNMELEIYQTVEQIKTKYATIK